MNSTSANGIAVSKLVRVCLLAMAMSEGNPVTQKNQPDAGWVIRGMLVQLFEHAREFRGALCR